MLPKCLAIKNKSWSKFVWVHVKGGLVAFIVFGICGIRPVVVMTESINKTVFLVNKHSKNFKQDCYVWLQTTKPNGDILYPVIKQVKGSAGDIIKIKANYCFVGGKKIGKIAGQTRGGKKLHPIKAGIIPRGKLFLAGTSSNSYDSRYLEFGLIDANKVKKAYALF